MRGAAELGKPQPVAIIRKWNTRAQHTYVKILGVAGSTPDARAGNSNMQKLHKKLENCKIFQNPARVDIVG